MSRTFKSFVVTFFVCLAVAVIAFFLYVTTHYVVPIITFHEVEDVEIAQPNFVSPKLFEWQLEFLKKNKYNVISLDELIAAYEAQKPLPRNSVVLTFDDGNLNNYTSAFALLKKYNFPATFFVPSHFVNQEKRLTTGQMKEMLAHGMTIGSHAQTHAYLPDLSEAELQEEIKGSKLDLEKELGVKIDFIAYPVGGFNDRIKQIVKDAGYRAACTTNRGFAKYNRDLFELKRIRFSDKDKREDILRMKLSGYYNLFRKPRNPG
jgi:peptidoglycan/xylan/chitin deacetylase (PgdA/CDA1 family)